MVQIKKYSVQNHYLKAMVYGKSGSGKTTLASTAPNPLYICAENGLASIASKSPDFVEAKTLPELQAVYKLLKEGVNYDTIVIDSLSEIAEAIKSHLTNEGKKTMTMREWGVYGEKMMQIVRNIINLPYHIVSIIHENITVDDDGNVKLVDIAVQGSSRSNIPRYFDVVAYTFLKGEEHKATCKPSEQLLTKDRLNCLPDDLPLDITEWIETFKSSVKTGESKVVLDIEVDPLLEAKKSIDEKMNKGNEKSFKNMIMDSEKYSEEQKQELLDYIDNKQG